MSHAAALCSQPVVPRLRCLQLEPDTAAVAAYLLQHGASVEHVYVGLGRHDKIFAANLTLAFAAEVVTPTRWHDLHPGIQTRADVQAQMIRELSARPLAYVVLESEWDDVAEPNDSARSSGVTALDNYLVAHFTPVFRAGSLTVLEPEKKVIPMSTEGEARWQFVKFLVAARLVRARQSRLTRPVLTRDAIRSSGRGLAPVRDADRLPANAHLGLWALRDRAARRTCPLHARQRAFAHRDLGRRRRLGASCLPADRLRQPPCSSSRTLPALVLLPSLPSMATAAIPSASPATGAPGACAPDRCCAALCRRHRRSGPRVHVAGRRLGVRAFG